MKQRRLTTLSIMVIESDILRELSFNDIIFDFTSMKARKDFNIWLFITYICILPSSIVYLIIN